MLTSIHPLYPIPGICHEYKSWQGFYDLRYGGSIVFDFFACISFIIAAYRFSVSWILRLRAFAFLLQLAVTVLYICKRIRDASVYGQKKYRPSFYS